MSRECHYDRCNFHNSTSQSCEESECRADESMLYQWALDKLKAQGYTEEDLEMSNPYNQWMYE